MKKILTFIVILMLVFSPFSIFAPKAEAQVEPGVIEAEADRVTKIPNYYTGPPNYIGWKEQIQYVGSEEMHVMFTVGQNDEELQFDFLGYGLNISFFSFRSGIARVIIDQGTASEINKTIDTFSGDNYVIKKLVTHIFEDKNNYREHKVRIIATGERNPTSAAEYIYVDAFIIPGLDNKKPTAHIMSMTPNPASINEAVVLKGSGSDDDGYIALYEWDFEGDGIYDWSSPVSGETSHKYTTAKTYYPAFRVRDNKGLQSDPGDCLVIVLLPPDLQILSSGITFLYLDGDVKISANVYNIGDRDAGSFNVEFKDLTAGQSLGTTNIPSLSGDSNQTTSLTWTGPQANHDIKVIVDVNDSVDESNENNNEAVARFGSRPVVNKIRAYVVEDSSIYYITDSDGGVFIGLRDISVKVRFYAEVTDANGVGTVSNVTFTLNDITPPKCVDKNGPPFSCEFDIGTDDDVNSYPQNIHNTLKVVAVDDSGLASSPVTMHFDMLDIPDWIWSIEDIWDLDLETSFDTNTMSYEIKFSFPILEGTGPSSDDPVNKGKDTGISDFTVEFSICLNMQTRKPTISGSGKLGLELFGYEPTITVTVTGELSQYLDLEKCTISVEVEIGLGPYPVAGIVIPLPKWAGGDIVIGVVIEGKITVVVSVTFWDNNGKFEPKSVRVTVTGRIEGKVEFKLPLDIGGAYAGVYVEISISGSNEKPTVKVKFEVGVMAGAYANLPWPIGKLSWEWSHGWKWTWQKDPFYVSKREWEEVSPGSDLSYGNNTIVDNLSHEDSPFVASDSQGNTIAVWVQNMSLSYSLWNGSAWSVPTAITNNSYHKMHPVITFDSNDNAVVLWTQANTLFNSSSTVSDFYDSSSAFEIYYSIWNGSHWATPQPITNETDTAMEFAPALASDLSGNVMAVWVHDHDGNVTTRADKDIYHSFWNGSSWSTPSAVSNMAEQDFEPSVAFDSLGNAIVVWVHDSNSAMSTFDDVPPVITNATVTPDPVFPGTPVNIKAKVTDYMGLYRVYANVTNPLSITQTIEMLYNMDSRLYEAEYFTTQSGTYTVKIVAEDLLNQTDTTQITFMAIGFPPPPNNSPVVTTADAFPNLMYLGDTITISAQVTDDVGVFQVRAEIFLPSGGTQYIDLYLVSGTPTNGTWQNTYSNTYQPGTYGIQIFANDGPPFFQTDATFVVVVVRPRNINNEIYYSTWNGVAWGNPTNITNPMDISESYSPSVAYTIWNRAIVVWTEYNGSAYKIFHTVLFGSPFGPPKPLPDAGGLWNLDPMIKVAPTGVAIITWRADPSDWGDLYYFILNTTRYMTHPYYQMVYSLQRLTKDIVTDWKHSMTIDSNGNLVIVWLKHRAVNVGNVTHPLMSFDDDDIYYKVIEILAPDFEIESSDINFVTPSLNPEVGDTILINATIHNTGTFDQRDVRVDFFDGNPSENGTLIGTDIIPLLRIGENATSSMPWNATFGDHEIFVVVDPTSQVLEISERNNIASKRILISTFSGVGLEDIRRYIGNVTISHSDTVSLILGEVIDIVFSGPGIGDYIIAQGNPILITIVNNKTTIISLMPSINITLSHSDPASLRITNSSVVATFGWLGVNDQIIISTMNTTGKVILNHTTPASMFVTDKNVEVTFTGSSLDEVLLPWMDTYVKAKHTNELRFTLENVSDPKLASGNATENSMGKFIDIETLDTLEWAIIKIYYSEEDLDGIIESNLRMKYWNETTQEWVLISDSGVNTIDNYVWANVTHFTIFAPIASIALQHDIAISNLIPSKTVVGQGYSTSINVTVGNQGGYTESFNVTVYANATIIETKTNITLTSGNSTIINFTWNTTGFAKGNYTISAMADTVLGETDLDDNNCTDGWILITKVGDIGGRVPPQFFKCDNKCDGKDYSLFLMCYKGTAPQEAMYLGDLGGLVPPKFFKCDGKVDGKDYSLFLLCYKGLGPPDP